MKLLAIAVATLAVWSVSPLRAASSDPVERLAEQFMNDYDEAQRRARTSAEPAMNARTLIALASMRDILGLPRTEIPASDLAAIDRMIRLMPQLAGSSGRFDHADLEPVIASLHDDLAEEVGREIVRRASERIQPGTFGESLRRHAVETHLEQHGAAYLEHGMEEARRRVRDGLHEFFRRTGTASAAPEPESARRISLADLKQFAQDAPVLERISRRCHTRGMPRFTFPNGMSVEDLKAIRANEPPPNGQIVPR